MRRRIKRSSRWRGDRCQKGEEGTKHLPMFKVRDFKGYLPWGGEVGDGSSRRRLLLRLTYSLSN